MPRTMNERLQRLARELQLREDDVFFRLGISDGPYLALTLHVGPDTHSCAPIHVEGLASWHDTLLREAEAVAEIFEPHPISLFEDLASSLRPTGVMS